MPMNLMTNRPDGIVHWITALLCLAAFQVAAAENDTALTIYSSAQAGGIPVDNYRPLPGRAVADAGNIPGYAVVRQDRKVELANGRSEVRFADVAALIDPTTVQFVSLTDPDNTRALEQNFQFDLVSTEKLLSKYIDKTVVAQQTVGTQAVETSGLLLSSVDGLVLKSGDGQIHALRDYSNLRFPELPGGLITRPTLVWEISARKAGVHNTRVAYQTGGMTWWADYNLTFTPGSTASTGFLDVGAWVSIVNQSGAGYEEAKLKLIAGDVQQVQPPSARVPMMSKALMAATAESDAGFAEKAFFEYHLYTLGRRTSLPNNSTKQIELFDAAKRVPARKTLIYSGAAGYFGGGSVITDRNAGAGGNPKVDVYLEFKNDEKSGLGVPLPKGRIRVSQVDPADQSLEFIGEDVIDHTPKNERVLVKLGSAFDVVGERKQTDFSIDNKGHSIEEEILITLRNHKKEPADVLVRENMYRWRNWSMLSSSTAYEKDDSRTIVFPVTIAAEGVQNVRYRVRYTW